MKKKTFMRFGIASVVLTMGLALAVSMNSAAASDSRALAGQISESADLNDISSKADQPVAMGSSEVYSDEGGNYKDRDDSDAVRKRLQCWEVEGNHCTSNFQCGVDGECRADFAPPWPTCVCL